MNLKKLFNYKYFFQNIKKSASVLALFCGIVPILNTIIFLLSATSNSSGYLVTLENISVFTAVCMYVLPFILAACLFDFIFKKKSIDFIGSMPITKKSIFTTNIIGGIGIIFVMLFTTALCMFISSLFIPTVHIPILMLFDYLIIFLIGYIFVYAASALAFSISGNLITGLATCMLLLFFIPFVDNYVDSVRETTYYDSYIKCESEECIPKHFNCDYEDGNCLLHQAKDEYIFYLDALSTKKKNYTLPYNYISYVIGMNYSNDEIITYNFNQLLKTFGIAIIYVILGYYFFKKKKLEISETSFGNFNTHLFVKFLTMVPICTFMYGGLLSESLFLILFLGILLLAYYFIFDLITRKKIEQVKKSLLAFFITIFVIFSFCYIVDKSSKERENIIKDSDVTKTEVDANYGDFISDIEITDKKTINSILSSLTETEKVDDVYYRVDLKLYVGEKIYHTYLSLTEEDWKTLSNKVKKQSNIDKISLKGTYYVEMENTILDYNKIGKMVEVASKALKEEDKECKVLSSVHFYKYENHQTKKYHVSSCESIDLQKLIVKYNNEIITSKDENSEIIDIHLFDSEEKDIDYLLNHYTSTFESFFIENMKEEIDLTKDILTIYVTLTNPYQNVIYYTNKKEEFYELVSNIREKAKDTIGYKEYIESLGEDYEY